MHAYCIRCLFYFCSLIVFLFCILCVLGAVILTRLFINCQITNATLELSQSINFKFHAVFWIKHTYTHFARVIIDLVVSVPIVYMFGRLPHGRFFLFFFSWKIICKNCINESKKENGKNGIGITARGCTHRDRFHS